MIFMRRPDRDTHYVKKNRESQTVMCQDHEGNREDQCMRGRQAVKGIHITYSSIDNFPKDECVIQSAAEKTVYESNKVYLVVLIDVRFPCEKKITYARPYVYVDEESGRTLYGWSDLNSSMIFGNIENSCYLYNEFVVGFMRVDEEYISKDRELHSYYACKIKSQRSME